MWWLQRPCRMQPHVSQDYTSAYTNKYTFACFSASVEMKGNQQSTHLIRLDEPCWIEEKVEHQSLESAWHRMQKNKIKQQR